MLRGPGISRHLHRSLLAAGRPFRLQLNRRNGPSSCLHSRITGVSQPIQPNSLFWANTGASCIHTTSGAGASRPGIIAVPPRAPVGRAARPAGAGPRPTRCVWNHHRSGWERLESHRSSWGLRMAGAVAGRAQRHKMDGRILPATHSPPSCQSKHLASQLPATPHTCHLSREASSPRASSSAASCLQ